MLKNQVYSLRKRPPARALFGKVHLVHPEFERRAKVEQGGFRGAETKSGVAQKTAAYEE